MQNQIREDMEEDKLDLYLQQKGVVLHSTPRRSSSIDKESFFIDEND